MQRSTSNRTGEPIVIDSECLFGWHEDCETDSCECDCHEFEEERYAQ